MGRALEQLRNEFEEFLADPEGYDQRRQQCDRIALAEACLEELGELRKRNDACRSAFFMIKDAVEFGLRSA